MDAHLPRPRWRGEDLGLPTGKGILTVLQAGEGEGVKRGREKEMGGGGREQAENFNKK